MGGRGEGGGGAELRGAGRKGRGRTLHHAPRDCCCPQAEGNLNIVMEFASLGSVEEAIKQRQASRVPFAEPTVIAWLQQLGGALQHMHSKQILHRDLKVCMPPQRLQPRVRGCAAPYVREDAAALGIRGELSVPYLHRHTSRPRTSSSPRTALPMARSSWATLASPRRSRRSPTSP